MKYTFEPDGKGMLLPLSLLTKLASAVVHADELLSPGGHAFDHSALQTVIDDPEVKDWLKQLGPLAPVKRSAC